MIDTNGTQHMHPCMLTALITHNTAASGCSRLLVSPDVTPWHKAVELMKKLGAASEKVCSIRAGANLAVAPVGGGASGAPYRRRHHESPTEAPLKILRRWKKKKQPPPPPFGHS
jgi:hypothetical protein